MRENLLQKLTHAAFKNLLYCLTIAERYPWSAVVAAERFGADEMTIRQQKK